MKLAKIVKGSKFCPKNTTLQSEPFSLPKFSRGGDNPTLNPSGTINNVFIHATNKLVSMEQSREKSGNRSNLSHERKQKIIDSTNNAIEEIFRTNKHKFNVSHLQDTNKSKLRLKYFDPVDSNQKNTSVLSHKNTEEEVADSLHKTMKNQPHLGNFTDKKIQDILQTKGPAKPVQVKVKSVKFKKLPKIPNSKVTINVSSDNALNNGRFPNLAPTVKKAFSPTNAATKMMLRDISPASPPTSKKITLETIIFGENPKEIDPDLIEFVNYDSTKLSSKKNGPIKSYAANTNQGILRSYNEDRVSIILNVARPENKKNLKSWPKIAFFGVFDGHGGASCADFLRDNLHMFITKDVNFPDSPKQAIWNGFKEAE